MSGRSFKLYKEEWEKKEKVMREWQQDKKGWGEQLNAGAISYSSSDEV